MTTDLNLDAILTEVGEFGLFQILNYFLICLPSALSATYVVNYMFSANILEYRCKIPECEIGENNREISFVQPWLRYAIPILPNGKWKNCVRYAPIEGKESFSNKCNADMFNTSIEIPCTEFIYATDERNLQTEFNIHCSESYKLALVGTVNNIGRFVFFPITGLLSDKYGRLPVIVIGMMCGSLFGLIKSFSTNYLIYLMFEFLESLGTTTFAGIFVLALEWVNVKYRIFGSFVVGVSFPLGELLLGFVAYYVHDYRDIIRILYTPGLLLIVYFWIVPESVRWLLVNGRVDRAITILRRIARVNGKQLSERSIEMIKSAHSAELSLKSNSNEKVNNEGSSITKTIYSIFKSKGLFIRFLNCSFQWINCCFCYYGLSLVAIQNPGENRYISFIFVVAIEIPALLIALPLLNRMKRRILIFVAHIITAITAIAITWIPVKHSTVVLIFFMLSKWSITLAFNFVYIFTAELWPTNVRTTIVNTCSMIGRIGSMVSPMVAIVAAQYGSLPSILFGGSAILAAILILFCPETYSKKLPDTVDEANEL